MPISDSSDRYVKRVEGLDILIGGNTLIRTEYSQAYVDAVFVTWYKAGKPEMARFTSYCPDPAEFGIQQTRPSSEVLNRWRRESFVERAEQLDAEVSKQMAERLIAEKVAMLEAHSEIGLQMQQMALSYLNEHADKLNANAAVRLLVEGVRIERESRGIPRTLEKMAEKSDQDLLADIKNILSMSPVEFAPPDENSDAL